MGLVRSERALEVKHYWNTMQAGITLVPLADYQDELEVISLMTASPTLREIARRSASRFDYIGRIALPAAGNRR